MKEVDNTRPSRTWDPSVDSLSCCVFLLASWGNMNAKVPLATELVWLNERNAPILTSMMTAGWNGFPNSALEGVSY